jgi:hypothetical protein
MPRNPKIGLGDASTNSTGTKTICIPAMASSLGHGKLRKFRSSGARRGVFSQFSEAAYSLLNNVVSAFRPAHGRVNCHQGNRPGMVATRAIVRDGGVDHAVLHAHWAAQ